MRWTPLWTAPFGLAVSLLLLVVSPSVQAQGGVPACQDVDVSQPAPPCQCLDGMQMTVATPGVYCTCTNSDGAVVPSPSSCNDMMQGRRVVAALDDLIVIDPRKTGSHSWNFQYQRYQSVPNSSNPNLGDYHGTPSTTHVIDTNCDSDQFAMPFRTQMGRLFATPNDFVISLTTLQSNTGDSCWQDPPTHNLDLHVQDLLDPSNDINGGASFHDAATFIQMVVDDLDLDGYDDVFVVGQTQAHVISAVDPSNPASGIKGFDIASIPGTMAPLNEPTAGDFNGDGLVDVAWIGGSFTAETGSLTVFFATICPGDVEGDPLCDGADRFDVVIDPAAQLFPDVSGATSNWVLENASLVPNVCSQSMAIANITQPFRAGAVALGNFQDDGQGKSGRPIDELIVTYVSGQEGHGSDLCSVDVWSFSYAPPDPNGPTNGGKHPWMTPLTPVKGLVPINDDPGDSGAGALVSLFAEAAYLDWYGSTEQAVLGVGRTGSVGGHIGFVDLGVAPVTVEITTGNQLQACAGQTRTYGTSDGATQPYLWGMAVGRFTTTQPDPSADPSPCASYPPSAAGACPYNPQIALLLEEVTIGTGFAPRLQLFSVVPSAPGGSSSEACNNDTSLASSFFPVLSKDDTISGLGKVPENFDRAGSLLHVGDVRGLSTRLGEPTVMRVTSHTQPTVVLQAPPMHVDYATPIQDLSPGEQAQILNLTVHPSFWTQYEDQTTDQKGASYQQTSSYSTSWTEKVGEKLTWALPLVESGTADFSQTWGEYHTHTTTTTVGDYETTQFGITTQTEFADNVYYETNSFNVYHYPYLGQSICPATLTCDASNPDQIGCPADLDPNAPTVVLTCAVTADDAGCECTGPGTPLPTCPSLPSDADTRSCNTDSSGNACCTLLRQPQNLVLSGPEQLTRTLATGDTLEWYQPVHMPKQFFSYPRSLEQALARKPGYELLAGASSDQFGTSAGQTTESATWTCTQSSENSVGDTHSHSFDADFSLTEGRPDDQIEDIGAGGQLSQDVDYSHSSSTSSLNTSTFTHTSSAGVRVNVDSSNFIEASASDYDYLVTPMILGTSRPPNVLDDPPTKVCQPTDTSCIEGMSDPTEDPSCSTTGPLLIGYTTELSDETGWWGQTYGGAIDIAFNHPQRWITTGTTTGVDDEDLQCRGSSTNEYCTRISTPSPADSPLADVWSNGFYGLRGFFVQVGGTAGPTRNQADADDEVFLQTRIYNFSLAEMAAGATAQVRFYAQEVDPSFDEDGNVDGISYVGSGIPLGDPVPVVNANDGTATINAWSASRDNFSLATTSFVPSSVPMAAGSYWMFWVVAWADGQAERAGHGLGATFDPSATYDFITDVPLDAVAIDGNAANQRVFTNNVGLYKQLFHVAQEESELAAAPRAAGLRVGSIRVRPDRPRPGGPAIVATEVYGVGGGVSGVSALLSEGDGENGGRIFDVENLAHILPGKNHSVLVPYRPSGCGTQRIGIEVLAAPRLRSESFASVVVPCEPALAALDARIQKPGSSRAVLHLSATLRNVGPIDLRRSTLTVEGLLDELGGAGELVRWVADADESPTLLPARHGSNRKVSFHAPPDWRQRWFHPHAKKHRSKHGWWRLFWRGWQEPRTRITLDQQHDELRLEVFAQREAIDAPALCGGHPSPTTELQTSLLLDDGRNPPLRLVFDPRWSCDSRKGALSAKLERDRDRGRDRDRSRAAPVHREGRDRRPAKR